MYGSKPRINGKGVFMAKRKNHARNRKNCEKCKTLNIIDELRFL